MKLMAHFSADRSLVDAFLKGMDVHGVVAKMMFSLECHPNEVKKLYHHLRNIAKSIGFGVIYGMGPKKLYETLDEAEAVDEDGKPITPEKAKEYYYRFFDSFPDVAEHMARQKKFAHANEYVLTIIGRKRRLFDINGRDKAVASYEERVSVNAPIQGSGGDMMMLCQPLIENDARLKMLGFKMLLQVHDELVLEGPLKNKDKAIAIVRKYMENALPEKLLIPITVSADHGATYAEAK